MRELNKLKQELLIMKTNNIKPNYAELARIHNCDYRTVKKYDNGYEGKPTTRNKESRLDKYKDEIKIKPDAQITLQSDKGNKFMVIQTERIDMQVELNKTIEKLFNNWNKLKEYINEANEDLYWTNNYDDILYVMQELEGSDSNGQ